MRSISHPKVPTEMFSVAVTSSVKLAPKPVPMRPSVRPNAMRSTAVLRRFMIAFLAFQRLELPGGTRPPGHIWC